MRKGVYASKNNSVKREDVVIEGGSFESAGAQVVNV